MAPVAQWNSWRIAALCLTVTLAGAATPDAFLCGQYQNVTDPTNTYTIFTNVWGRDSSGSSCVNITKNASSMATTWSWLANETLVHAYPNVNFNPIQRDPIQISNLHSLDVKVKWTMKPALSSSSSALDTSGLALLSTKANVAFDAFFDPDIRNATNTTAPKYEMMVWIGKYGSVLPIGATTTTVASKLPSMKIGKEAFTLYQGNNDNGQQVFSWVAASNKTEFEGDISPLLHYLWRNGLVLASNYVGVLQFGTEQKHSTSNVTFVAYDFALNATRGTPKAASMSPQILRSPGWLCPIAVMVVFFSQLFMFP